jgi:tripartite-type tricarboxylate transporter receptor subunit TctC
VALLHHDMVRAVAVPEVQDRLVTLGFEPATTGPEQLAPFIKAEIPKWAGVIRAAGINTD